MERHEEGLDFVICPKCKSHILVEDLHRQVIDEQLEYLDVEASNFAFTCDWWPCGHEFDATVRRTEGGA